MPSMSSSPGRSSWSAVASLVVVVDGLGATVVVVAAPAAAPPTTPSRGPHTMTAMAVRAIDLG